MIRKGRSYGSSFLTATVHRYWSQGALNPKREQEQKQPQLLQLVPYLCSARNCVDGFALCPQHSSARFQGTMQCKRVKGIERLMDSTAALIKSSCGCGRAIQKGESHALMIEVMPMATEEVMAMLGKRMWPVNKMKRYKERFHRER